MASLIKLERNNKKVKVLFKNKTLVELNDDGLHDDIAIIKKALLNHGQEIFDAL